MSQSAVRRVASRISVALAVAACARTRGAPPAAAPAAPADTTALALVAAVDRVAALPLWPGFALHRTPLALFDGERTLLVRHPAPPAGYVPLAGRADVAVRPGRDPAVTANTSAPIAGVPTATVLLDGARRAPLVARAALVAHEAFHVFQRARHPRWQANEATLFTYPVDDAPALARRLAEDEALRRALAAPDDAGARCWARARSPSARRASPASTR
jgi:hypothetical protein